MSNRSRADWADDEDLDDTISNELPQPTTTTNKDGTKTIVSWRFNDDGKKVKTTRRIRFTVHKEVVNPRVAERKQWSKFGLSAKDGSGVCFRVTLDFTEDGVDSFEASYGYHECRREHHLQTEHQLAQGRKGGEDRGWKHEG